MPDAVSTSVDVPGLLKSADPIEAKGHAIQAVVNRMQMRNGGLTDPTVFGVGDNAGDQFHAMWKTYVQDFEDGVRNWSNGVINSAEGIRTMAKLFKAAEDNAEERAALIERMTSALAPGNPGAVDSGGGHGSGPGTSGGTNTGHGPRH